MLRKLLHLELRFEACTSTHVADLLGKDARCSLEAVNQLCILNMPPPSCFNAFVKDRTSGSVNS